MSKASTPRCLSILALCGAALAYAPFATAQSTAPKQSMDTMNKMDTNKDGQVSKDEFMKWWEQKFDSMDKNKNKMLTQDEWVQQQLMETDGSQYPK